MIPYEHGAIIGYLVGASTMRVVTQGGDSGNVYANMQGWEHGIMTNDREDYEVEKLSTIQKRETLNEVHACDEKGNGGANHFYEIVAIVEKDAPSYIVGQIQFQNGARKLPDSLHGVLDTDLLEIVRHRLQAFQKGDFATRENAIALTHIEEALLWMNKRVEDRIERNVLGTNNK